MMTTPVRRIFVPYVATDVEIQNRSSFDELSNSQLVERYPRRPGSKECGNVVAREMQDVETV